MPAISYDSSLFFLSRKMQTIGYKAEMNNSNGFGGDKGKYVAYDYREEGLNFKKVMEEISKVAPSIKFDGICSNNKIPSVGDYYRYLTENGFLHVYGVADFLNHMKVPTLLEHAGITKSRLLLINDHLNYRKSVINKFIDLDGNSKANSLNEEFRILKAIANILDMNMIKNRWTSDVEKIRESIVKVYKNLGAGYYMGAINYSEEEKEEIELSRYLFQVHGCPVLRM